MHPEAGARDAEAMPFRIDPRGLFRDGRHHENQLATGNHERNVRSGILFGHTLCAMKKEATIMLLGGLLIASLMFVTWAEVGISTWIVGHSGVEDLMEKDGKHTLLFLKDAFFHLSSGIYLAEIVAGSILLWLLWRRFYGEPR
ncbi:MAG: hypothetical protein WCO56_19275 [Verrucomicrobiota bacterium]